MEVPSHVWQLDFHGTRLPPDCNHTTCGSRNVNDFGWAEPPGSFCGGLCAVEVYLLPKLEIKLLGWYACTSVRCSSESGPGGSLHHGLDADFSESVGMHQGRFSLTSSDIP